MSKAVSCKARGLADRPGFESQLRPLGEFLNISVTPRRSKEYTKELIKSAHQAPRAQWTLGVRWL